MNFRDRIRELRRVPASELRDNPANYRRHGTEQRARMAGLLRELGFVDAVLARECEDGGLELIDGHLRRELSGDELVPVLVTDLSEAEAAAVLATFDQIGKLADEDPEQLANLAAAIEAEDAELRRMLDDLIADAERALEDAGERPAKDAEGGPAELELSPHEHYDCVVVLARTTEDWHRLLELLEIGQVRRRGRVGAARGFPAEKLIERLKAARRPAKRAEMPPATEPETKPRGKPKSRRAK